MSAGLGWSEIGERVGRVKGRETGRFDDDEGFGGLDASGAGMHLVRVALCVRSIVRLERASRFVTPLCAMSYYT